MRKLVLAAALATLALPAVAQPASDPPAGRHHRLFISPSGEPFRVKDGLAAWFSGADADHDGALTSAEFAADAERAFRLFDVNEDGVIDGFEIQAYERERAPEITEFVFPGEGSGDAGRRGGMRHGRGRGHGGDGGDEFDETLRGAGRNGAARFSLLDEPEPLLAADADVDGKVTRAEWARATARRFDKLDRGHDGRLTLAGLRPPLKGR